MVCLFNVLTSKSGSEIDMKAYNGKPYRFIRFYPNIITLFTAIFILFLRNVQDFLQLSKG